MNKSFSSFIKYRLKHNSIIRFFFKPYMELKGKKILNEYKKSAYSLKVKNYRDKYKGCRCFIIGNGPSLCPEDLEKLKSEYTFGANRIYEVYDKTSWRPTFYVAVDGNFIDENLNRILSEKGSTFFLEFRNLYKRTTDERIVGICRDPHFAVNRWNDKNPHIVEDISQYISDGYTVTFTSIQLAVYMGFKEIYLLGVDFSYSVVRDKNGKIHKDDSVTNYFNGKTYDSTEQNYQSTLYAYQQAKKYCDTHNIKIYNATRGGKLEVFERVDFDTLFPKNKEEN